MPRVETEGLRKKQIMEATRDVISEKGLDRTTMRDIGHRAGMSAAIVCYYFDDKKRLMKETLIAQLAVPTMAEGESVADFLATEAEFDADAAGAREYRFVELYQAALRHLIS